MRAPDILSVSSSLDGTSDMVLGRTRQQHMIANFVLGISVTNICCQRAGRDYARTHSSKTKLNSTLIAQQDRIIIKIEWKGLEHGSAVEGQPRVPR